VHERERAGSGVLHATTCWTERLSFQHLASSATVVFEMDLSVVGKTSRKLD